MAVLEDFAKYVRPEVPGCPEPIFLDAIRRACITVCEKTEAIVETITFSTVVNVNTYFFAVSTGVRPHSVKYVFLNNSLLRGVSPLIFNDFEVSSGFPVFYVSNLPGSIKLWPTPDKVYNIKVGVVVVPTDVTNSVPDILYTEWKDLVAAIAKSNLLGMAGQSWANSDAALMYKVESGKLLTLARIVANKGFVGASLSIAMKPIV